MKTIERIENGVTIVDVIMEDQDFASDALKAERLRVCAGCEYRVNEDSCSKCSCLLVNRVSYVDMYCPEGKW